MNSIQKLPLINKSNVAMNSNKQSMFESGKHDNLEKKHKMMIETVKLDLKEQTRSPNITQPIQKLETINSERNKLSFNYISSDRLNNGFQSTRGIKRNGSDLKDPKLEKTLTKQ